MCPCRGARASSQVSQTAARGRNRLAEFTGESLPAPPHPSGHITGFILNRSASHAEAIAEGKATQARAPRLSRGGVDSSFGSLRPDCGCR